MTKRKSRKTPKKIEKYPKLQKEFNCPFCSHTKSVEIQLDRQQQIGDLRCRTCGITFSTSITRLDEAVDVYSTWVDRSVEANEPTQSPAVPLALKATRSRSPTVVSQSGSEDLVEEAEESWLADRFTNAAMEGQSSAPNNRRRLHRVAYDSDNEGLTQGVGRDVVEGGGVGRGGETISEADVLFGSDE